MQAENWDDIRVFLTFARVNRIAEAARILKIDATTVSRKMRRLEDAIGERIFEKTRDGHVITPFGENLLARAEGLEGLAASLFDTDRAVQGLKGQVRLSVSEGFGSWFLAARLASVAKSHPELSVELVAKSGFLSPTKREADIAIMLSRPKSGPLISRKLADYSLMLYGAPDYLKQYGMPRTPQDLLEGHRLIGYISDLIYAPELDYLNEVHPSLQATLTSSSINAQLRLIAGGGGIGVLPCFMGDQENAIQRILPSIHITRSFWIVTHQSNNRLAKIRYLTDWLVKQVEDNRECLMQSKDRT